MKKEPVITIEIKGEGTTSTLIGDLKILIDNLKAGLHLRDLEDDMYEGTVEWEAAPTLFTTIKKQVVKLPLVKHYVKDLSKYTTQDYPTYSHRDFAPHQVMFKPSSKEIGVILQVFPEGDFRTDDWGMSCRGECRFATLDEIKQYRPNIIDDIL